MWAKAWAWEKKSVGLMVDLEPLGYTFDRYQWPALIIHSTNRRIFNYKAWQRRGKENEYVSIANYAFIVSSLWWKKVFHFWNRRSILWNQIARWHNYTLWNVVTNNFPWRTNQLWIRAIINADDDENSLMRPNKS